MVLRSIGGFVGLSEAEMEDQSIGGLIIALLLAPFRLTWGFIIFMIFAWTTSRSGRAFVFALPAMCFIVLYVAVVWAVGFKELKPFGLSAARYSKASDENEDAYNPEAALLYAKKMVATDPENSELSKYELGLSYDRLEKYDLAYDVMKWIAPDVDLDSNPDQLGYSEAYYWMAGYYSDEKKSNIPEDQRKPLARKNMELAYLANDRNVFAVLGLAGMNRADAQELQDEAAELREQGNDAEASKKEVEAQKQLDKAVRYLERSIGLDLISFRQLYASNVLIDILQERGENKKAELLGLQFIGKFESFAEKSPDFLPLWISIVKVCIQIGDFERGEAFILRGYQLAQDSNIRVNLAKLAAQIEVEKAKTYEDLDNEQQFLSRLYALSKSIRTDFQVPEGYNLLLHYIDGFDADSEQDIWVRDSLLGIADAEGIDGTDPGIPGVIHIILGMRDLLDGLDKSGKNHWEIASQQFQFSQYVINNLIRKYVDEREADVEVRNKLLETAIEMFPQEPSLYASRGRYYLDDEDYQKAIDDLEFANTRIPEQISILENLLICYENVGPEEKAAEIKNQIDELKNRVEIDTFLTPFSSSNQIDEN